MTRQTAVLANPRGVHGVLERIESENGVRVLVAALTGSRAYGWAGPRSDTDIGFVFTRESDAYLSLRKPDESIVEKVAGVGAGSEDIDLFGWNLRKLLALFRKSNARALELILTPERNRYVDHPAGLALLRGAAAGWWSPRTVARQELHRARAIWNEHLREAEVDATGYLPVIHGLLRVGWLTRGSGLPPLDLDTLVRTIGDEGDREAVAAARERRRRGEVRHREPRDERLGAIIEAMIREADHAEANELWPSGSTPEDDDLDAMWRAAVLTPAAQPAR